MSFEEGAPPIVFIRRFAAGASLFALITCLMASGKWDMPSDYSRVELAVVIIYLHFSQKWKGIGDAMLL